MRVRLIIGTFALVLSAAALNSVSAQAVPPPPPPPKTEVAAVQTQVQPCPSINLNAPNQPVRDGTPIKFTVNLSGGNPQSPPFFDWSTSSGMIRSGQGTPSIEVDSTGAGNDKTMYATVLIGGLAPECTASANATVKIAGPAQKLDEFGELNDEELGKRLDSLMTRVTADDFAYVIAYGGKTAPRGTAINNLRRIRAYINKAGTPFERIVSVDGGYREQPAVEFWMVPIGAESPKATPTVNPRDVTPPKPVPANKKP